MCDSFSGLCFVARVGDSPQRHPEPAKDLSFQLGQAKSDAGIFPYVALHLSELVVEILRWLRMTTLLFYRQIRAHKPPKRVAHYVTCHVRERMSRQGRVSAIIPRGHDNTQKRVPVPSLQRVEDDSSDYQFSIFGGFFYPLAKTLNSQSPAGMLLVIEVGKVTRR
ncbi:hypothetical protein IAD21_01196 [Abditibacteriota bacterium]|nr:hypothetical protein IAD21_01196 [Abditibacteriota bacterium]